MRYAFVNAINHVYATILAAAAAGQSLALLDLIPGNVYLGRSELVLQGKGPWVIVWADSVAEEMVGASVVKEGRPEIVVTCAVYPKSKTYPYGRVTKVAGAQVVGNGIGILPSAVLQALEVATNGNSLGLDPVTDEPNVQNWDATTANMDQTGELFRADIRIHARFIFQAGGR